MNGFETIVKNGAFAHYERMPHIAQCFERETTTDALVGVSME